MSSQSSERRAKLILRVAASVASVQAVAHLTLFLRSQPRPASAAWPLAEAMREQAAPGHTTYWAMYFGYGLLSALMAFFIAGLIWVAANFDAGSRRLSRQLVGLTFVVLILHAALIVAYFFVLPLIFDIIVAGLLAFGWVALREGDGNR